MVAPYQTPGVYVVEQNAFPNSVVEVATAIPAFIGNTQFASYGGRDLAGTPVRVDSFKEFEDYFGKGFVQPFSLTKTGGAPASTAAATSPAATPEAAPVVKDGDSTSTPTPVPAAAAGGGGTSSAAGSTSQPLVAPSKLTLPADATGKYTLAPVGDGLFYLYNAIRLFYLNGGGTCYIISIGTYDEPAAGYQPFIDAIQTLVYEQDPTMLLCPDALRLEADDYNNVLTAMLGHCETVQSRVALFDVLDGSVTSVEDLQNKNTIENFRDGVGMNYLNYGIAYFPWVNASVISDTDLTFVNLNQDTLTLLQGMLNPATPPPGQKQVMVPQLLAKPDPTKTEEIFAQAIKLLSPDALPAPDPLPPNYNSTQALSDKRKAIHSSLLALYPSYKLLIKAVAAYLNVLPVSPAMAGVYTAVDSSRGVWKAPANVSLNAVVSPTVSLSDTDQANLNVDAVTGKSINVIRSFKGMGVLVWGARTLDGNSQDWRYISVRRTMIMIEQSVKLAAHSYVFEPNDANTWVTVKSAINNFLFNLWKQGALAGAVPADAYQVLVGLGSTMTADDILNGYMNVTVLVALVRPAEFIQLTFQQQMQKS